MQKVWLQNFVKAAHNNTGSISGTLTTVELLFFFFDLIRYGVYFFQNGLSVIAISIPKNS